jgi:site-specific DNA recombinase
MRVAIYARVSTESQEARGTIGSQLEVLRKRVATEEHELVAEYRDDGWSGARLDRPGLDALRDAAEAGRLDAVWCLSPDRLARLYAYQVIVLDELAHHGVTVLFHDTPPLADDPQAQLLTQVQGVIAEYERAKIAERYRRGKLWRARAGEVIAWKCSYGYRRIARSAERAAHLEIYEPEAMIVRRIFRDYVESNLSMRQISWQLNQDLVPSPSGKAVWGVSMIGRLIRNEAYVGRAYYNRTASVLHRHPTKAKRQIKRPRDQWIPIPVPAILDEELFEAAQRVSYDNSQWSPRRTEPNHWLLRGLVKCGHCGVSVSCHKMRGRNGAFHYYYYCRNHDPLRAGGDQRRCPERNVRADELDAFVFDQVRATMLRPDVLLAGEAEVSTRREAGSDELLATQLASLDRKIDAVAAERRRLADLYRASFIEREELLRRGKELEQRSRALNAQHRALIDQREELAQQNRLRERVEGFARRVRATIDRLDFTQRQKLLRLVIDEVRVSGWLVEIRFRIPLDNPSEPPNTRVSTKNRLRSLHIEDDRVVHQAVDSGNHHGMVWKDLIPVGEWLIGGDQHRASLVSCTDQFEQHRGLGVILMYIGEVVEDQQVVFVELADGSFELQRLTSGLQLLHDLSGAGEQDAIAVLDKCATDGRSGMALAGTWRAEQQQVGRLVQPGVACGERHNARLAQHRHDREVEIVECLAGEQTCVGKITLGSPAATFGNLQLGECTEEPCRRPAFLVSTFGEFGPKPGDRRQAKVMQLQRQARGVDLDRAHDGSPTCGALSKAS